MIIQKHFQHQSYKYFCGNMLYNKLWTCNFQITIPKLRYKWDQKITDNLRLRLVIKICIPKSRVGTYNLKTFENKRKNTTAK